MVTQVQSVLTVNCMLPVTSYHSNLQSFCSKFIDKSPIRSSQRLHGFDSAGHLCPCSGVARKIFLPRQSLYIDLKDLPDSQTLSSMGGTVLQVGSLVGWKKLFRRLRACFYMSSNAPA